MAEYVREKMRIFDGMRYYKKTDTQNNMPRARIRLRDDVDGEILQYAAETAFQRHRLFRMCVVADGERFYLQENLRKPVVHLDDGKQHMVCVEENHDHMMWIGYAEKEICMDFFHGITDGIGCLQFVRTLLYYYCQKKYGGLNPEELPGLITAETPENLEEYKESILFLEKALSNEPAISEGQYTYERAFVLPDAQMESDAESQYYELRVDAAAFDRYLEGKNTSTASVFALFMNRAIADRCGITGEPIVGAMAVNARRAFGAEKTLQCCVATIPVWYDKNVKDMPLSEQLKATKQMIRQGVQPGNILAGAARTKKFNKILEMNYPSLEEKQRYCRELAAKGLDRYTYGISYVGEISFGKGIDEYVDETAIVLCANTSPVILEIAKCKGTYFISYCTHLVQDPYVYKLQEIFESEGIPCTCEKKEDFVETRVCW